MVGSIAGCDIVTRSAFSGKWKLVLYQNQCNLGLIEAKPL
jgi:hypothetical protein